MIRFSHILDESMRFWAGVIILLPLKLNWILGESSHFLLVVSCCIGMRFGVSGAFGAIVVSQLMLGTLLLHLLRMILLKDVSPCHLSFGQMIFSCTYKHLILQHANTLLAFSCFPIPSKNLKIGHLTISFTRLVCFDRRESWREPGCKKILVARPNSGPRPALIYRIHGPMPSVL